MALAQFVRFEERLLDELARQRSAASPSLNRTIARFSSAGEYGRIWFICAAAGVVFDARQRRDWLRAVGDVIVAYGCGLGLKNLIRRPRPAPADGPALVMPPTQLSFPSSHATTSFAAATAFAPLVRTPRALVVLAGAMSASRIYLGVHYPSDVLAGALLGAVLGRNGPFGRTRTSVRNRRDR